MGVLLGWLLFSIIPAAIAANKGRSAVGWYFLSLLFSPLFAGLLVLVLSPVKKDTPEPPSDPDNDRLPCPLCKEPVRYGAVRCPHCQGDISSFMEGEEATRRQTEEVAVEQESGEMAGLTADQLLNIVRYKRFPEEKRRTALARLQEGYAGSRELSEALRVLPPVGPTESA